MAMLLTQNVFFHPRGSNKRKQQRGDQADDTRNGQTLNERQLVEAQD